MIQFYFLSIMLNLLIGVMFVFDKEDSVIGKILDTNEKIFQLVVGGLSIFVALIKLLSPVNGVPFFGDLFPFLAGVCGGAGILIQFFAEKSGDELSLPEIVQKIFIDNKKYIGIACMVVAIIHFICPSVLFL